MQTATVKEQKTDSLNAATAKIVAATNVMITKTFFLVLYAAKPETAIIVIVKVYGNEQVSAEIKINITGTAYTENAETSLLPPSGI